MKNILGKFIADDSGAAAAEYVLILAIIGAGVGAGAIYLGGKIGTALSTRGTQIETCTTNSSAC